ncbi:MAG: glutamate 5-kinase [Rhizobiales bacterium]|nr:glutamate 5-kinase [Hyphomicrobiales bacterium]NRB14679.1 glutamate 5-kinase [Hyphomicrobiales bacterium]
MNQSPQNIFETAHRIVIKIGSSLLIDANGQLRQAWLDALSQDVQHLLAAGKQVILVSSGAIALGRVQAGFAKGKLKLEQSQAAAAIGQISLARAYENSFKTHEIQVAQVLLSLEDSENRKRYINATNTLNTLTSLGFVPIINENDTIATTEIRFGDNDRLAARVASMINADLLILLSDIDGLYSANPQQDANAKHIAVIKTITEDIQLAAGSSGSDYGTGGMVTKILAAQISTESGCPMIIADGRNLHPIDALAKGAKSSLFLAQKTQTAARKKWLNATLKAKGSLTIDKGAEAALYNGKSLLSAGVVKVAGSFDNGDTLDVINLGGKVIAYGLTNYNSNDATRIIGKKSHEIADILGYAGRTNIVHRNNLVLIKKSL